MCGQIFVVCEGYKALHKSDSCFLNAKYVSEELDLEPQNRLQPKKWKKAKPEKYPEN
jgi:hypothetical protein